MTDALTPREQDDALAAEYVLGLLDAADRAGAEARLADPGFAALVRAWEARLAPLNDEIAEVAPSAALLPRIEARLFPAPAPAASRRGWFGWLAGGLAGGLAAAALALAVWTQLAPTGGQLLATLAAEDAGLSYEIRHKGGTLTATRVAGTQAPEGQVHELWIIAPDAAPVSLGLLDGTTLAVAYPEPPAGWTLAVSVEPAGGSPTGAPTGPVILAAQIGA